MSARKVRTLSTFELSQTESAEFNYDQSESTTQIWVAQLGSTSNATNFHRLHYSIFTDSAQASMNVAGLFCLKCNVCNKEMPISGF